MNTFLGFIFLALKHVPVCSCWSGLSKVDGTGFLEASVVHQHYSTSSYPWRMHAYNPQAEHGRDGSIHGRAIGVKNVLADFGALLCVRGHGVSFVRTTRWWIARWLIGFFCQKIIQESCCDPRNHQHHNNYDDDDDDRSTRETLACFFFTVFFLDLLLFVIEKRPKRQTHSINWSVRVLFVMIC